MGLGDALYLQSVVRHLVSNGERLEVCNEWPDVFRPLGDRVRIAPFSRSNIQILAHYSLRKGRTDTNQWQDCCVQAGINESIDMQLDWKPTNERLLENLRGKRVLCVGLPRAPMGRTDGFGKELLPDCGVIQRYIDAMRDKYRIVQIGSGKPLHKFTGIDVDLANATTVTDLLDVASVADGFLGYVSFLVPLAESFNKPALFVWSRRGLRSAQSFISRITPQKVLSRASSRWIVDDEPVEASAFL